MGNSHRSLPSEKSFDLLRDEFPLIKPRFPKRQSIALPPRKAPWPQNHLKKRLLTFLGTRLLDKLDRYLSGMILATLEVTSLGYKI